MNAQKPVSPNEFKAAQYSLEKINPAVTAMEALNKRSVGNDTDFAKILCAFGVLKKVRDANLSIVDAGNAQYEGRPIDLIGRVATRLNHIPAIIDVEEKHFAHRVSSREFKINELRKKSFSSEEIDRITPPIPQSEYDASQAIVDQLRTEATKLKAFLDDAPRFDIALLNGTSLGQFDGVSA